MTYLKYILVFTFTFFYFNTGITQSISTEFGKNRVQYHDDFNNWWRYETDNFITYWYGKGRNIAEPVIQIAELNHDEIQNIMEHRINDKIEIIVYTDISDVKQSNIGLEETFTSKSGQTKVVGNKMFVYYDGNHQHLEKQIREGIASVYLGSMLFGENFQEVIQNAVLLDLPQWYKEGIKSFCGSHWNVEVDDELRDLLFQNEEYSDFERFSEEYPRIAGHSMWFFLEQTYGISSISNLLYLTRITRNLDNAIAYVYNQNIEQIQLEWADYYDLHYRVEDGKYNDPTPEITLDLSNKDYVPVSTFKLSNDGKYIAYAYNNLGKYRVKIKELATGQEKTVFKYGHKNAIQETDYDYPVISWNPNSEELTIIFEHKDVIKLQRYNVAKDERIEQIIPTDIQRIFSCSYLNDNEYVFTALKDGFSDIFRYDVVNREYKNISNDYFDDLEAEVVVLDGKEGILFSSNRTNNHLFKVDYDTILPLANFDIFFYDLEADDKSLQRITNTKDINEHFPYQIEKNKIVYLSSESGITNRYVVSSVDPSSYFSVSNVHRNMIRHHAVPGSSKHLSTYYYDGAYQVFMEDVDWNMPIISVPTRFSERTATLIINQPVDEVNIPFAPVEAEISEGEKFQSKFDDPPNLEPITQGQEKTEIIKNNFGDIVLDKPDYSNVPVEEFVFVKATASRLKFRLDNFTTNLDNNILFEGLESYTGNNDELLGTPLGILLKANIKDIFEDYSLVAGARYPLTFDGSEYFLTFENRKKLIDRKFALYRKSQTETIDETNFPIIQAKKVALLGLAQWKYPFTIYRSLRLTTSLRTDNYYVKSVNEDSFNAPISNEKRVNLKLEFVYDNTIDIALNIKHGTRYKIFAEAINKFDFQLVDGASFDASTGFTTVLGFDARHYIPFLKHGVIALRGTGATSLGNEQNIYYLGGVDRAFNNGFDNNVNIPDGDYAYKTNAFHLRGFSSNIRNGTTYGLINSEIRVPVFRYLMNSYGGSSFLRNFQFVLFYDIGTAWHGSSPYSDKNPLNTVEVGSPPVELTIRYYRDPLVMGFGGGVRMNFLGYLFRFDYAKGVETRQLQDAKLHFSVGMDF